MFLHQHDDLDIVDIVESCCVCVILFGVECQLTFDILPRSQQQPLPENPFICPFSLFSNSLSSSSPRNHHHQQGMLRNKTSTRPIGRQSDDGCDCCSWLLCAKTGKKAKKGANQGSKGFPACICAPMLSGVCQTLGATTTEAVAPFPV